MRWLCGPSRHLANEHPSDAGRSIRGWWLDIFSQGDVNGKMSPRTRHVKVHQQPASLETRAGGADESLHIATEGPAPQSASDVH